jgi:uncharacterized iron-regulated membrane protein
MTTHGGFVALVGVASFGFALASFMVFGRVNRILIALLAVAFACFSFSLGLIALHDFQEGVARVPAGRRSIAQITRDLHPFAFWVSTFIIWLCTIGLSFFALYLLHISLMRRRA